MYIYIHRGLQGKGRKEIVFGCSPKTTHHSHTHRTGCSFSTEVSASAFHTNTFCFSLIFSLASGLPLIPYKGQTRLAATVARVSKCHHTRATVCLCLWSWWSLCDSVMIALLSVGQEQMHKFSVEWAPAVIPHTFSKENTI